MRVGFFGKGGAGKTTTAAGFISYLMTKTPYVLAIDADVNVHLKNALQINEFSGKQYDLGEEISHIATYLKGQRNDLGSRPLISSTPPSLLSNFIRVDRGDPFIIRYGLQAKGLSLLTVGSYQQEDVGASCYHTKLGSLAMIFHHLLDATTDYVVADTNAGTDNVATSLAFVYDMNVFVVEPTEKSIAVYLDFTRLSEKLNEKTFVIANKIDGEHDKQFIEKFVNKKKLLGLIPYSKYLKAFEQGDNQALSKFALQQYKAFDHVLEVWQKQERNWEEYLTTLQAVHKKNSLEWYDAYYGTSLSENLDPNFEYQKVISKTDLLARELVTN